MHKPDLRIKTREAYECIIKSRIVPHIGSVKLLDLDGTMVQAFINELAEKYSPRGAHYVRIILKMSLKDAVRLGYLKINPAEYVKAPRHIKPELVASDRT